MTNYKLSDLTVTEYSRDEKNRTRIILRLSTKRGEPGSQIEFYLTTGMEHAVWDAVMAVLRILRHKKRA